MITHLGAGGSAVTTAHSNLQYMSSIVPLAVKKEKRSLEICASDKPITQRHGDFSFHCGILQQTDIVILMQSIRVFSRMQVAIVAIL